MADNRLLVCVLAASVLSTSHFSARGKAAVVGFPLNVRGQRLITKQVPVLQDGKIVGAIGLALFLDFEALRRTYSKLSNNELAINNAKFP
jgi:hypothetical protein